MYAAIASNELNKVPHQKKCLSQQMLNNNSRVITENSYAIQ